MPAIDILTTMTQDAHRGEVFEGLPEDRLAPFILGDGDVGVLCMHGFSGTPYETRELAVFLADHGYTVMNTLLDGHAQDSAALGRTRWPNWWQSAINSFLYLTQRCTTVFVCGMSMGGTLGLKLATRYRVAGVVTYGTPVFMSQPLFPLASVLRSFVPHYPRFASDIADPVARRQHPNTGHLPLASVASFGQLLDNVKTRLADVRCPLLLMHATQDHTVDIRNMSYIAEHVSSRDVQTLTYRKSYHLLTVDVDRHDVMQQTLAFLKEHAG